MYPHHYAAVAPATQEQKGRNLVWFVAIMGGISALYLFPALWKDITGKKK
tara:strand:- start:532 stop:681 length:150 start_codon:yes stop_codon:yes gene_type:complete